jgi:hypothetical protein
MAPMASNAAARQPAGSLPETLEPLRADIETYFARLDELLEDGHEGRFVLIHSGRVVSTWDTFEDAYQAGRSQFGLEPFLAQPVTRGLAAHVMMPIRASPAPSQP